MNTTPQQMIRQGDVLLVPVTGSVPTYPAPAPLRKLSRHNRLVIAEGESSLHEHTISADDADLVRQGERMLLNIATETVLATTHTQTGEALPRHTPIRVGPGLYEVRIQRRAEVTPAGMPQRWSRVAD